MDHPDEQDQTTIQIDTPPPPVASFPPVAMRRPRRIFSGVASIAALLMLILLARSLAAYRVAPIGVVAMLASTSTATPVPTEVDAQTAIYTPYGLRSVAMVSATDVWAVGEDNNPSSQSGQSSTPYSNAFLHFDGVTWKHAQMTPNYMMSSICMLSSSEGWAAGGNAIMHYSGGHWMVDSIDHSGQYETLNAITMVSTSEGWAVGATGDGQITTSVILHYANGHWTRVAIPSVSSLNILRAISMASPDDGWAVGSNYTGGETSVVFHYSGGEWKHVTVGEPGPLYDISALSPDNVWAVGASNPATGPGFILHYAHGVWRTVHSPTINILHTITMRSQSEGWIGGDGAAILHYDGTSWQQVSPTIHHVGMMSVSVIGDEGWATGSNVLLHLHNGVWAPYIFPPANT